MKMLSYSLHPLLLWADVLCASTIFSTALGAPGKIVRFMPEYLAQRHRRGDSTILASFSGLITHFVV